MEDQVVIRPSKKLFLNENEEEDELLEGQVELNPLFLSSHVANTDYDQLKILKLPKKNIARSLNLGFAQFLQRLELNHNALKNIRFLEDNTDLKYLDVSNNEIRTIDPVQKLDKLEILKCSNNEISYIGANVLDTSSQTLKALVLNNNIIRTLPRANAPFRNLNTLVISHNSLDNLKGLDAYPNITKISASYNKIKVIPNDVRRLVGLSELRLAHNKLIALPDSISNNANLEILILNNNLLSSFEYVFSIHLKLILSRDVKRLTTCNKLKELDMSENPLSKQENYRQHVLELLPKLEILDKVVIEANKKKKVVQEVKQADDPKKAKDDKEQSNTGVKRKHENKDSNYKQNTEKPYNRRNEEKSFKKDTNHKQNAERTFDRQNTERPFKKNKYNDSKQNVQTEGSFKKHNVDNKNNTERGEKNVEPQKSNEQENVQKEARLDSNDFVVEKLVKRDTAKKPLVNEGEVVNLADEKEKKRIQREISGGYAEQDEKHAGVVGLFKTTRHDRKKKEVVKADVLSFLSSETTDTW
ncbi:protein phosphatase 1 regulatory subunit [Acrasis kona]|uniref:Protein phosphatase 1 regulatory subunit n=1 Tax=Acrasis kona TaxID=1008807 RepID=A0AAW2YW99_9EUKA